MSAELALAEKVLALDRALNEAGVAHAVGGALALAYYGEPRVTVDVDINLFVPASDFPEVARLLRPLGVKTDAHEDEVVRDGQVRMWWGRNPVDLFFAYDPFHEAMKRATRDVDFGGERIRILAPEHLIVCKAVLDRRKDWLDIEQMLVGVGDLQSVEVFSWLEHMVGDENRRLERLQELWDRTR
jgi:hypothetical protein